jgi:hypothetical protein
VSAVAVVVEAAAEITIWDVVPDDFSESEQEISDADCQAIAGARDGRLRNHIHRIDETVSTSAARVLPARRERQSRTEPWSLLTSALPSTPGPIDSPHWSLHPYDVPPTIGSP